MILIKVCLGALLTVLKTYAIVEINPPSNPEALTWLVMTFDYITVNEISVLGTYAEGTEPRRSVNATIRTPRYTGQFIVDNTFQQAKCVPINNNKKFKREIKEIRPITDTQYAPGDDRCAALRWDDTTSIPATGSGLRIACVKGKLLKIPLYLDGVLIDCWECKVENDASCGGRDTCKGVQENMPPGRCTLWRMHVLKDELAEDIPPAYYRDYYDSHCCGCTADFVQY